MKKKPSVSLITTINAPARLARRLAAGAILLSAAAFLPQVQAQVNQSPLPFYEPFPSTYINGEYLGSTNGVSGSVSGGMSGAVWDFGNSLSSSCARVQTNAALAYPGLTNIDAISQSLGMATYYKDTSSTKDRGAALLIPTNIPAVYASCLLNFSSITNSTPQPVFGLGNVPSALGSSISFGADVFINPAGYLQISKNSSTPATNASYTLTTSNTYLIVIRYKYNPGKPDQVDLWIDPTPLGNDALIPPPTLSTTNNANITAAFGSVCYFQSALPPNEFLDEVRAATNWSGVTPTFPPAGTVYNVTGGGVGCAGASFNVGLNGSDAGVSYLLYTNGVATGQSVNGTGATVGFGPQNVTAIYTVLATNMTTGTAGWMNTNTTVSVVPAPNIAVEPTPTVVATNGLAAFTVSSIGSGFLYQWYRNGGQLSDVGEISGSQSATLVISPATTADVANYYVKVSNPCGGSIVSTTNALTLDAPATLVWYGDGISNLWDLATSTNWNFSPDLDYPTNVFNYGDNVIFDDTSPYTTVTLNTPNLSPSSITINGSQNYTFSGSGSLAGNGDIVVNTTGSLTVSVPNTQTGGIVLTNGVLYFGLPTSLGSGPITMAGGSLYAPGTGAVTVTNTINVVGSNTFIGVNSPGGQNLSMTGPLNGIGGSLGIINLTTKNAAVASVEFTANGFTFNLPVDLNPGTGTVLLGGFNTSGSQIWNGLLSDGGGVWRSSSGGTTVLNNTNTYSGATRLSGGILGVSCDSISILAPPALDAGPMGTGTFTIDTGGSTMELVALGGPRIIGNAIAYVNTNGGAAFIVGGSNNVTLTGTMDLTSSNRVIQTDNTGLTVLSGGIMDSGAANGLTNGFAKTGAGILYLDGINTYIGDTTNVAGTLAGSGSLTGRLLVQSGSTIGAGDAGSVPGTFSVGSDCLLAGNGWFRLNKSQTQSNDVLAVTGSLMNTGAGSITVTNMGPALAVGDTFTLFSQAVSNGAALTISGGGMVWSNYLALNGSIKALSVQATLANYPTNLTVRFNGSALTITWPATHLGWILQSQTNSAKTGLLTASNAWTDVTGSSSGTSSVFNDNATNPAVYFRLRHP